jgi:multiple sugar transport system permease protein
MKLLRFIKNVILWMLILFFLVWTVSPILWAVSVAFKPAQDLFTWPPTYIPSQPTFTHFENALKRPGVLPAFTNSLVVMAISTPISVFLSALAAYSLARYKLRARDLIKYGLLTIRMVPGILIAIPIYAIAKNIGLTDKLITLIIAYTAFNLPFNIWMLTGFFEEVPREIEESAKLDGCNPWQVFWKIIIPLSAPALMSSAIFCMLLAWNEFQFAVILTFTESSKTLPIIIAGYSSDRGTRYGEMAATGALAILPVLAIGMYVQKYLVRGLTAGAVKG